MSHVPPSKSQISESPAKNAVTRAVNEESKEVSVDRKIRFFGVLQAFREGRYPDNSQIDDALKYTLANSPIETKKLSHEGQKLVQDVREIIETARQIVMTKNGNEEFQTFLHATKKSDIASNVNVKAPVNKADAQEHRETAGEAFRTLVTLFLRNGELRKIFQDLGYVGRDMFADGAAKAAEVARPDEDKLDQVDQPAPENEFHDDVPGALQKKKAEGKIEEAKERARTEGADHANDVANAVDPNASREQNQANLSEEAKKKANLLSDKIPQERKDQLKEQTDRTKDYLKEKFPKERRDQFVYRLKKVVVECQRHSDYQDAIDYFLDLFEQYKGHANSVHTQVEQSAGSVRGEGNVKTAEISFRRLIESFANGKPTQPILDAIDQLYTDAKNDDELRAWFKRLDAYVRRALQEPGFIMKDEADAQARQLRESGKKFFVAADGRDEGKYVPHKDRLFKEIQVFFSAMGDDKQNQLLGQNFKNLVSDLFLNSDGNLTFKSALWRDITQTILPRLLEHVDTIPVPRIELVSNEQDLVIENIAIDPANILPNIFELDAHNHFKVSQFKELGNEHSHSVRLTLHQIQLDMRGVAFWFRKKTGFKLNERGVADVFLGGKGLTLTIQLDGENAPPGKKARHIFKVKTVKAKIDKLNFAIRDSKHDVLVKILRPLAVSVIKKAIVKAAESGIRDALEDLDRQLLELRDRIERNKEIEGKGFTDAVKETFQKDKSTSDKQNQGSFKFVTSKRQSMVPNLGHPDGWSSKVEKVEEKVKSNGDSSKEWYSPAFSIVSANQPNPKNTEAAKHGHQNASRSTAAAAGAAGVAGVGAGAATGAGLAAAAAKGAGQPGGTSTVYTTTGGAQAPGALASTGTATAPLNAGAGATAVQGSTTNSNGVLAYYQDEPTTTKPAPAISSLQAAVPGTGPSTTN